LALFFSVIFYTKVSYFGLFEHTDNKAFSHTFGASCQLQHFPLYLIKNNYWSIFSETSVQF
jgi:hypothetical protein